MSAPQSLSPSEITKAANKAFPGATNSCHAIGTNWALAKATCNPDMVRPGGYISGPSQFALADAALWFMTFVAVDRIELMALTSELSIRFLRPAIGETLWARATIDKGGRRSVVGTVRLWVDDDEGSPTATAQGTYVLPSPGS